MLYIFISIDIIFINKKYIYFIYRNAIFLKKIILISIIGIYWNRVRLLLDVNLNLFEVKLLSSKLININIYGINIWVMVNYNLFVEV